MPNANGTRQCRWAFLGVTLIIGIGVPLRADEMVMIGRARVDITPTFPTILAGYGGRVGEHTQVDQRLFARALAIGSEDPVVTVSVDNCGVPGKVVEQVAAQALERWRITPEHLVIASTHTHNAPSLTGYAPVLWAERATADEQQRADRYTRELIEMLVEVVGASLEDRRPATIAWGQGQVSFGGNRRVLVDGRWSGFGLQADGPVDHTLPVMVARDAEGKPLAFWLSYACHCTTLGSGNAIAGDWAGYAAEFLERSHPGSVALVTIGCGADVGPQPSGSDDFARQHGQAIHDEVQRLLDESLEEIPVSDAKPRVETRELQLAFAEVASVEHWQREAARPGFEGVHARRRLAHLEQEGKLPEYLPYTITTWSFGDRLHLVFLPGEVVVDYAVRLKRDLDWTRLWIQGWSDDVPGYIPSRRLLDEGGYETDFSMIYYDHPSRFAPEIEEKIIEGVKSALGPSAQRRETTPAFTSDRYVISPQLLSRRWRDTLGGLDPATMRAVAERWMATRASAVEGVLRMVAEPSPWATWYDYTGGMRNRPYLRQSQQGQELSWETSVDIPNRRSGHVIFTGGVGYLSQPETAGFELQVDGIPETLAFDIVNDASEWVSTDGKLRLSFLPLWRSTEDAAGLFLLSWNDREASESPTLRITVRSRGSDSLRWFAIDPTQEKQDWSVLEALVSEMLSKP